MGSPLFDVSLDFHTKTLELLKHNKCNMYNKDG